MKCRSRSKLSLASSDWQKIRYLKDRCSDSHRHGLSRKAALGALKDTTSLVKGTCTVCTRGSSTQFLRQERHSDITPIFGKTEKPYASRAWRKDIGRTTTLGHFQCAQVQLTDAVVSKWRNRSHRIAIFYIHSSMTLHYSNRSDLQRNTISGT